MCFLLFSLFSSVRFRIYYYLRPPSRLFLSPGAVMMIYYWRIWLHLYYIVVVLDVERRVATACMCWAQIIARLTAWPSCVFRQIIIHTFFRNVVAVFAWNSTSMYLYQENSCICASVNIKSSECFSPFGVENFAQILFRPSLCRFCAVDLAQISPFCFCISLLYLVRFYLYLCLSLDVCARRQRLLSFNGPSVFPFKDFTLDFYFRQFWKDPRLSFRKRPGVEQLSVGSDFIKSIWVPDTFFVNEKQSYFHIATTSNEFIRIHHTGSITRSIR